MSQTLRNLDLKKLSIPNDIIVKKDSVVIKEDIMSIENSKVFYREAKPLVDSSQSKVSVLLLHGQRFSSKTWLDLGTMHILGALGFHAIAIDLPGFGNSPPATVENRTAFLHSTIQCFNLKQPVIVSPSMSGWYTLPYLVKHWKSIAGYIPVAPVGFEVLEELPSCKNKSITSEVYEPLQKFLYDPVPDLSFIKTPTMVVFGEKDRSRSSALLGLLPMSQCQEIPNGGHPAYLDDPNLWHKLLYNFLLALSENL